MEMYIDESSLKKTIEYFRAFDCSKPEQIGLFLYFKAAGLNQFGYSEYKKWGDFDTAEREQLLRSLYDLAGVFDASCENGLKCTALFPFSISNYYKSSSFYNGGTVFKSLGSRISDTLDNALVSTIIQRSNEDKNLLKFNETYIKHISEKQLKQQKISLSKIAAWCFRFWDLHDIDNLSERDITDVLILAFLKYYNISLDEYKGLFRLDNDTISVSANKISGPKLRELLKLNNSETFSGVEDCVVVDYMTTKRILSYKNIQELLALRGDILSNEKLMLILKEQDEVKAVNLAYSNSQMIDFAWFVGATGHDDEGVFSDFSEQYIAEGRWENRYDEKYVNVVKQMSVGDHIVIKSSYTKKNGLPFDNGNKTVGVMAIKATGIITHNYLDGKNIDVKWTKITPIKEWYGDGVLRTTIHSIKASDGYIKKALLDFVFENAPQDYSIFEQDLNLEDNLVLDNNKLLPQLVKRKKQNALPLNFILYGAPGTGKTYATAEYAMSIIEDRKVDLSQKSIEERVALMKRYKKAIEDRRITFTTFHQSYGYEDFIQGLRPDVNGDKFNFVPVDGVFKKIADEAIQHGDKDYVIIIDEINRANISKVFGELITLIEEDKRWGEINALSVTLPSGQVFAVPNNLYIIGTMNSADKSISLIDAALRRRFDFIEVVPNVDLVENATLKIVLKRLNEELFRELDSTDLLVGHAYFIGKNEDDLCNIMNHSIIPLLYEYFYDNSNKVKNILEKAVSGYNYSVTPAKIGRIKLTIKD